MVDMNESIWMLSPEDTPLLTGVGSDGQTLIGSRPTDEVVFSWMDDSLLTPRTTIAAVITADTVITVATGSRLRFSTGDVVRIGKTAAADGEQIRISGYGVTDHTLLVTRAYSGSATTYASDSIMIGTGTALSEGSDPEAARTNDRVESSNVTQIFGPTSVHLSATEQVVRKYGVPNEWAHQLMARTKENAISREQAYLYGIKFNSTTAKIRTTGGMADFIATNVNNTVTELTVANIQTFQQTMYNQGGSPNVVMANPVSLANLNDITNTSIIFTEVDNPKRGRVRVAQVFTEFGAITVARNRWMFSFDAFFFNRENVVRRILRPLTFERLAKTGDADKGQIVAEEGLEVGAEEHLGRMGALSYSGAN